MRMSFSSSAHFLCTLKESELFYIQLRFMLHWNLEKYVKYFLKIDVCVSIIEKNLFL